MSEMNRVLTVRFWGEKLLLIVLAFVAFAFFSNDFGLVDIQKSAIVLAVGIDKEESGEYSLTASVAVPKDSEGKGKSGEKQVTGKGKTVAQAFRDINLKTGSYPKLPFCDLILLGESVIQEDVFAALGYFLRNEYMSDNCLLAACKGKAEEALAVKFPDDPMTSLALGKILATEARQAGLVATVNLKDFAAGYYSEHKSGYMPEITLQKETVSADTTACFYQGKKTHSLTKDQSFAFNLVTNPIRFATLAVNFEGEEYALGLKNVKGNIRFKMEGEPHLYVTLSASAQTLDTSKSEGIVDTTQYMSVEKGVLEKAEKMLKSALLECFESTQKNGSDIFEVADKLKKYQPKYHEALKEKALLRTIAHFEVKIAENSQKKKGEKE